MKETWSKKGGIGAEPGTRGGVRGLGRFGPLGPRAMTNDQPLPGNAASRRTGPHHSISQSFYLSAQPFLFLSIAFCNGSAIFLFLSSVFFSPHFIPGFGGSWMRSYENREINEPTCWYDDIIASEINK